MSTSSCGKTVLKKKIFCKSGPWSRGLLLCRTSVSFVAVDIANTHFDYTRSDDQAELV